MGVIHCIKCKLNTRRNPWSQAGLLVHSFLFRQLTLFTFTCHAKSAQFLGWISLLLPAIRCGCDCASFVAVIVAAAGAVGG